MYARLVTLCILTVFALLPAHATAQSGICGAVLGPGGHYQLTGNLACPAPVTVTDGATLDLGGFALTWTQFSFAGVVLTGTGAQLRNGTLGRAVETPLTLVGEGGHTVHDITIELADGGVFVLSDNNALTQVTANGVHSAVIVLVGEGNLLEGSQSTCDGAQTPSGCITVEGDFNTVRTTTAIVTATNTNPHVGISVTGHSNTLQGNHATSNRGPGIWVQGTGNTIRGNAAAGAPFALVDANACGVNTWTGNHALTANPPCLLDAPPPFPGPQPPPPPGPVASTPHDLNGDGTADLLWQHASGAIAAWYMQGGTLGTGSIFAQMPDPDWQLVGSGDLDGDGHPDLLWQHSPTGVVGVWMMAGTTVVDSTILEPGAGWLLNAVGDLDTDGSADLIWRHASSGHIAVWLMQGKTRLAGVWLPTIPDMQWGIVAAEDVDGDGQADLIWQHAPTGQVGVWHMAGTTPASSGILANTGDPAWHIAAVGDVDADGHADLIWRHASSGQVAVWKLNGGSLLTTDVVGQADNGWQLH